MIPKGKFKNFEENKLKPLLIYNYEDRKKEIEKEKRKKKKRQMKEALEEMEDLKQSLIESQKDINE